MKYIISHDIGTTGIKSCLFDQELALKGYIYNRTDTWYPQDGSVLQSPGQWWNIVASSVKRLIGDAKISAGDVACICTDGHMNGCIPVDKDNRLLMEKTPLWADFSSVEEADSIKAKVNADEFYRITGCGMDMPIYPAAKILKIKEKHPDIYEKTDCFIGTKDYINMKLTGKRLTDYSDGSNYGLMDIRKKVWSKGILEAAGIDEDKLPEIVGSCRVIGGLTAQAAGACGLQEGTPVVEGAGDVPSASIGAGAYREGVYYINLGSASWLSKSYAEEDFLSDEKFRPFVLCHAVDGLLASQLVSYGGGICCQWIVDLLAKALNNDEGSVEKARDMVYASMERQGSDLGKQRGELIFLPYLRGGMALAPGLKGSFLGLSMEHDAYDMIDAVQTGVAYHMRSMMPFMTGEDGKKPESVRIIGGGARSARWRQIIADVCGVEVVCAPELQSATARGTAVIGGVGCGLFKDFTIADHTAARWVSYAPNQAMRKHYDSGYERFLKIINALSEV